ncbi:MAG: hypothetical protein MK538_13100 [Planctomycetes bacterium]|nr:hypothetical protein [Planctomycetota bacterium]
MNEQSQENTKPLGPRGGASTDGVEARRRALEVLARVERENRFVDEVLVDEIGTLQTRDRALLQEITFGVLRHRITLDALISFYLKFPMDQQDARLRHALRLGAYQLIYLSKIPPHAAVHRTIEALKVGGGADRRAVGFVNAVLKKLSADVHRKDAQPSEDRDDPTVLPIRDGYCHLRRPLLPLIRLDRAGHLALKYSHPKWLVSRWIERFGEEETRLLCEANNQTPVLTARVTFRAPSREEVIDSLRGEGFHAESGELENSIYVGRGGELSSCRALTEHWIQIQDETSIRIGDFLSPPANARVADFCAAPGGKAAQLLERVRDGGHVVALDRSDEKLALVVENLSWMGAAYTTHKVPSAPEELDLGEKFSHILVDAPCSNTGVLARRPEARWRLTSADIESLAELQLRLLEAAYRHLKPGGRMVFGTCSIESSENETVVSRICARHSDLTELKTELFLPHRTSGDGGFYSLLLRERT